MRRRGTVRGPAVLRRRGLPRRSAESGNARVMRRGSGRSRRSGGDASLSASNRGGGKFRNRNSIPVEYRTAANDEIPTAPRRQPSSGKNNRTRRWPKYEEKPGDRKGDDRHRGRYFTRACERNRREAFTLRHFLSGQRRADILCARRSRSRRPPLRVFQPPIVESLSMSLFRSACLNVGVAVALPDLDGPGQRLTLR